MLQEGQQFVVESHSLISLIYIYVYIRYDLKDKSQLKRLEEVERLVSEFGPTNPSFIYSVMLPKFLRQRLGFDIVDRIHDFFDFFSKLYEQGGYSIGKLMAKLNLHHDNFFK